MKTIFNYFPDNINETEGDIEVFTPTSGDTIGFINNTEFNDFVDMVKTSNSLQQDWRHVPGPERGDLIRIFGNKLREYKAELGELVTKDCGKIYTEGLGEVQEMIDICDFAVGLSRQLYGLTMPSERAGHRLQEQWHPIGTVAIISAFNFPVAVWSWNTALALVCGNSTIWKPSEKAPFCALYCKMLFDEAVEEWGDTKYKDLVQVVLGDCDQGHWISKCKDIALVSATGSTGMGKKVAQAVANRLGTYLLELGGNNAMIVSDQADLKLAVPATVFSAVGTIGQRCTTLRRAIVHEDIYDEYVEKIKTAYDSLETKVGDPMNEKTLLGPLIDEDSWTKMEAVLTKAENAGCKVHGGQRVFLGNNGVYVTPAIVETEYQGNFVKQETFAPILYVLKYKTLDDAIFLQNDVPQGLSSCIFTESMKEAETFLSAWGSDCGLANVNVGPSGAEIGGAFGGNKDTGGGRESGSDAWKSYMRRQTNTINYSNELPLAQGVKFDV